MAAHHSAQGLASLGRHGDSMLVHMSPHEVAGLNYLAKKQGTKLTINPETGLPEAFSLGGFFSSLLPMFAGMALGPGAGMMPLLAGAATGAGLAAVKGENPLMGGLMGGLGGYSGANLAGGFGAAAGGAGGAAGTVGANGEIGSSLLSSAGGYTPASVINGVSVPNVSDIAGGMDKSMINTGLNIPKTSMMNSANIINQSGAGAGSAFSGASSFNPMQTLKNSYTGAKNVVTGEPGSWDAFKNYFNEAGQAPTTNFQAGMKIAMPLGGAVLGGLEPTDIYGEPMKPDGKDKYDPYSTLNLSGDTGLRLYAAGGDVNNNQSSIASGGLQSLYGTSDNSGGPQALSRDGYGVGRLEGLTAAGSRAKAADMFYAQGGPVSFADGGDTEGVALEQLSMSPDSASPSPGGIVALANSAQMSPQGGQASDINLAAPPTATDGSLITQVANNLQADPNYQPKNPIEAAIVKQLKGTDPMQEGQQGLGSLAPAQPSFPTAATFAPAPAMGPTDYSQSSTPYMAKGGYLNGSGDGMSDSIPATIEGKQPARLADGEFVVPADVVSHIGNGSSKAGSKRLYAMLDKVRKARTGHTKQGKQINPSKYMPA